MRDARPPIPASVVRQLRQESGFGCAICGNPIVEYHHIIEWHERNHFEPEHMVALCRNHHKELHSRRREHAYKAKANPINIRNGLVRGHLFTNKTNQALVLGNTRFIGATTAVSYYGNPLFGYRVIDSEIQLQVFVPNKDFWPSIEVCGNQLTANLNDLWDIDFKTNYVKFWQRRRTNFLTIDFRKADVEISGNFSIGDQEFKFSPKRSDFGGPRIENMTISMPNGGTAISHGGKRRLLRPNLAMHTPSAKLI